MTQDTSEHISARICVLLNGGSGKTDAEEIAVAIRSNLSAIARNYEVWVLNHDDDIASSARAALDEGFEVIVAAGGDGTIAAVASALRGGDASLGIIPLGTFNYFARSLDLPTDIASAVRLLGRGVRRPLRVGDINGRIFLNKPWRLPQHPTHARANVPQMGPQPHRRILVSSGDAGDTAPPAQANDRGKRGTYPEAHAPRLRGQQRFPVGPDGPGGSRAYRKWASGAFHFA